LGASVASSVILMSPMSVVNVAVYVLAGLMQLGGSDEKLV
jgi:hypothetical protein